MFNKMSLMEKLISDENIYLAIYSVESYIFNKELYSEKDLKDLRLLKDIFNISTISKWIEKVRTRILELIDNDSLYINVEVYFKPKKFDDNKVVFRPLHIANLLDQIVSVSMMNVLVYDVDSEDHIVMSGLSRLIPHYFYGNRVSSEPEMLFKNWTEQYKTYSSLSNELFAQYHDSHEYRFEVNLDLIDFFPSINPTALYNYICDKLPINITDEEAVLFKKIIEKLMFTKVTNLSSALDRERYYIKHKKAIYKKETFALGIPQGMPQAYLFANLCMIEIDKIYTEEFQGRNLFYVDDSVIFTNEELSGEIFTTHINNINEKIEKWVESLTGAENKLPAELVRFHSKIEYQIVVHSSDGKSTFTNIKDSHEGEIYLRSISRETSKAAFDLNTSYSDEESRILRNKITTINEVIESEIIRITTLLNEIEQSENQTELKSNQAYLKKLVRYKKFFKYRKTEMQYREDDDVINLRNSLIKELKAVIESGNEQGINQFFDQYNEDILGALIGFVFKNSMKPIEENLELIDLLVKLNLLLFGSSNETTSYIYKAYKQYIEGKTYHKDNVDVYESIKGMISLQFPVFKKKNESYIIEYMLTKMKSYKGRDILDQVFLEGDLKKIMYLVNANTDEIRRRVLNAIFSYGFQVELNDMLAISKQANRKLTYGELRILVMLRNKRFKYKYLDYLIDEIDSAELTKGIDYTILQVLKIFKTFIMDPMKIDSTIQVHKYTCDIWKNGSKYLYFYTLHNQEHAVDLIQNAIKIVRAVDYIQISQSDYHILFLACYLHDISMVTFPSLDILQEDRTETNLMAYDLLCGILKLSYENHLDDARSIKKLLKEFYNRMDAFFEGEVRKNHAKDSGREIRHRRELSFIDRALREVIAEVSEAHGSDVREIYMKKSTATNSLVSKKFMEIILRLADLLDMSNYRVSRTILNNNLNNMTELSAFHWLSHVLTEGYELRTEYYPNNNAKKSFLNIRSITEKITLLVSVNLSQLTQDTIKCKCKNVRMNSCYDNKLELICGEKCNQETCNFLCKWFVIKNEYLFMELDALQKYLNSLPDNYYESKITVEIKVNDKTRLSEQEFGIIRGYTNKH